MEKKKNNKKIFIIIGFILIVIIAVIVGFFALRKNDKKVTANNNVENTEETTQNDYSALKSDIEKAIKEKNLIQAVNYYNVLKFAIENDENANKSEYDEIKNDLQALKDERKSELLTKVNSSYDDMTQQTRYTVKGAKTEFDEDVHFMPILGYDDKLKAPIFGIQFGIVQDNWIFFDSLIINIDGTITNIDEKNFDKYTDTIGGGYIFEYCAISSYNYPMFYALVENIINGNEVKIRFVGKESRGNVDFTLTQEEKENLKILYELSLCL